MTLADRRVQAYANFRPWLTMLASRHSLRVIGSRAGIDHSTISRLIAGRREPKLATARALIEAWVRE